MQFHAKIRNVLHIVLTNSETSTNANENHDENQVDKVNVI